MAELARIERQPHVFGAQWVIAGDVAIDLRDLVGHLAVAGQVHIGVARHRRHQQRKFVITKARHTLPAALETLEAAFAHAPVFLDAQHALRERVLDHAFGFFPAASGEGRLGNVR